jgi:hypothetical protein
MATKQTIAQAKYDAANCKNYHFKLVFKTDQDIIDRLSVAPSMQGYIKELIRQDIKTNPTKFETAPDSVPVSVPKSAPEKKMSLDELYKFLEKHTDAYDGTMYGLLNALVGKHIGYTPDE